MDFGAFTLVKMIADAKGIKEEIDGIEAFEYCNQGDEQALKALEDFCDMTATGLYNLQAVIDPDKIAIGGGIISCWCDISFPCAGNTRNR